jgi:hypothetical protein
MGEESIPSPLWVKGRPRSWVFETSAFALVAEASIRRSRKAGLNENSGNRKLRRMLVIVTVSATVG